MCLTNPATVIDVRSDGLLVDLDGRRQLVANVLVPEARVGDDVLVGMGRALCVLAPADAARLRELLSDLEPTLERA
jgi:hydrogenase expression/formation protein HypC